MQDAAPAGVGAMAAVLGAEDQLVLDVCAEAAGSQVVVPANFNSPGQIVIGGDADARALAHPADARSRQPPGRSDGRPVLAGTAAAGGAERRCQGA
ncbi:hypothetical protein G6F40_016842 [Rhizopus arrhizus]|nr:hypothetical protein G6F40_016842 [Rhizopus arrhizus]